MSSTVVSKESEAEVEAGNAVEEVTPPTEEEVDSAVSTNAAGAEKESLETRIRELEERERELQKLLIKGEADFGVSRAKFKDVLLRREESHKAALDEFASREQNLHEKISRLETELDDARSLVVVAECTKEDAIEMERRKHVEEMASLRHLVNDQSARLKEVKKEKEQLENEVMSLRQQVMSHGGSHSDLIPAALNQVSKIAKRVGGALSTASSTDSFLSMGAETAEDEATISGRRKNSSAPGEEDAILLQSMEEEIKALKEKLREVDGRCQAMSSAHTSLLEGHKELFGSEEGSDFLEYARKKLEEVIESKSEPTRLNGMYLSILNAEKVNAELESQRLRAQLSELNLRKGRELRGMKDTISGESAKEIKRLKRALGKIRAVLSEEQLKVVEKEASVEGAEGVATLLEVSGSAKEDRKCVECSKRNSDLIRLREREEELKGKVRNLETAKEKTERTLERCKEDLIREGRYRQRTEEEWEDMANKFSAQLGDLKGAVTKQEDRLKQISDLYEGLRQSALKHLRRLSQRREEAQAELKRLQEENETLLGRHYRTSEELQAEIINLPDSVEELQVFLLQFRQELVSAKIAQEHAAELLEREQAKRRTEMSAWRKEKEGMEVQVNGFRERLSVLGHLEARLSEEEERYTKLEHDMAVERSSSEKTIGELKAALQDMKAQKDQALKTSEELRLKVARLQEGLQNTEIVQRDFVHLTQSLQKELENIRQADTEVRWVHEEDVHQCLSCKSDFSVTKRKHHCRHCGKIFCADCISHVALSGPNRRPAKVCDVCYTILNKDVAPYFCTKPPRGT